MSLVTPGVTDLAQARSFYEAPGYQDAQQPDDEGCFFQAGEMVFGLWAALGGQRSHLRLISGCACWEHEASSARRAEKETAVKQDRSTHGGLPGKARARKA